MPGSLGPIHTHSEALALPGAGLQPPAEARPDAAQEVCPRGMWLRPQCGGLGQTVRPQAKLGAGCVLPMARAGPSCSRWPQGSDVGGILGPHKPVQATGEPPGCFWREVGGRCEDGTCGARCWGAAFDAPSWPQHLPRGAPATDTLLPSLCRAPQCRAPLGVRNGFLAGPAWLTATRTRAWQVSVSSAAVGTAGLASVGSGHWPGMQVRARASQARSRVGVSQCPP